jgi:CMP-N-acetylneuraminic acid synthetase
MDGYNKIKSIIENEYDDIKINEDNKKEKNKLPKEIEINGHLYLNKNILIYENPRNLFILKSLGFI